MARRSRSYIAELHKYPKLCLLSVLLVLPTILDFLSIVVENKQVTIACYFLCFCLAYTIILKNCTQKSNLLYGIFLLIVAINCLIFRESWIYIFDISFLLCLFLYIPVAIYIVRTIVEWDKFLYVFYPMAVVAVLMNVYINFLSGADLSGDDIAFNYMELSYAVLPALCGTYAYFKETRRWAALFFFIIGFVSILNFGSRAVVLYSVAFIFAIELISQGKFSVSKVFFLVLLIFGYMNFRTILATIAESGIFTNSRFITKVISDDLFSHDSRVLIYDACKERIASMGLEISGLFGDRPYCYGAVYPHNIVYEILMSLGWILGLLALGYLSALFLKGLINGKSRSLFFFFFFAIFCRFLVSGSYLIEGRFWLMLFAFVSLGNFIPTNKKSCI